MKLKRKYIIKILVAILLLLVFFLFHLSMRKQTFYEGISGEYDCSGSDTCPDTSSNCSQFVPIDPVDASLCNDLSLYQSWIKPKTGNDHIYMMQNGVIKPFSFPGISQDNVTDLIMKSDYNIGIDVIDTSDGSEVNMYDISLSDGIANDCSGVQWIIPFDHAGFGDTVSRFYQKCNMRININPTDVN
mgnify:CR=1 FL=1|jgi:hypothetical protein